MATDLDWFPFFLRDFDEGTREMTNEEVGAYLRLLYYQWHYGSIPADRERASKITGERFGDTTWSMLLKKFVPDASVPEDRLVNKRMQQTRIEQEARYQRRVEANRANGKRGGLSRGRKLRALGTQASEQVASESLASGNRVDERAGSIERVKKKDNAKGTTDSEDSKIPDTKTVRARRQRRVPEDFKIGDKLAEWLKQQFPKTQLDALKVWTKRQLEKFRNHEFNSPRSDWDATFRNWVLSCIDRGDVPAGGAAASADEERAWQDTLKLAAVFKLTRLPEESREAFTARVKELNDRRLNALRQ